MPGTLRIAVEGCGHGTLDAIYASVAASCEAKGWDGVDLLIIGGDFQAVRNAADLNCMAVPVKYREIGDFHKYYSGERLAPYLTVFVGGNHEASNHLWELYYGGWVARNIYYLGAANVVRLGSLRIAGLSGIWKGYNYKKPHYERLPYNQDDVRSIYHVRELDTRKLLQIRTQVDVGISHDWPRGVEWMGDWQTLFRRKDLFEADARAGNLGSVAAKLVLERLRPPHWFSAHLHIKYAALVDHAKLQQAPEPPSESAASVGASATGNLTANVQNDEEIDLDIDDDGLAHNQDSTIATLVAAAGNTDQIDLDDEEIAVAPGATSTDISNAVEAKAPNDTSYRVSADLRAQLPASFTKPAPAIISTEPDPPTTIENATTKFLALDKCLPKRDFLQLLELEPDSTGPSLAESALRLTYDPEWLAISRAFALSEPLQLGAPGTTNPPDKGRAQYAMLIAAEEAWVEENITQKGKLLIPENFEITAPVYDPSQPVHTQGMPREYNNPQTQAFCELLGIDNLFQASDEEVTTRMAAGPRAEEPRGGGRGGRGGRGRGRDRGGNRGRGFGRGGSGGRGGRWRG